MPDEWQEQPQLMAGIRAERIKPESLAVAFLVPAPQLPKVHTYICVNIDVKADVNVDVDVWLN